MPEALVAASALGQTLHLRTLLVSCLDYMLRECVSCRPLEYLPCKVRVNPALPHWLAHSEARWTTATIALARCTVQHDLT